jgi:hypothetical protein
MMNAFVIQLVVGFLEDSYDFTATISRAWYQEYRRQFPTTVTSIAYASTQSAYDYAVLNGLQRCFSEIGHVHLERLIRASEPAVLFALRSGHVNLQQREHWIWFSSPPRSLWSIAIGRTGSVEIMKYLYSQERYMDHTMLLAAAHQRNIYFLQHGLDLYRGPLKRSIEDTLILSAASVADFQALEWAAENMRCTSTWNKNTYVKALFFDHLDVARWLDERSVPRSKNMLVPVFQNRNREAFLWVLSLRGVEVKHDDQERARELGWV